MACSSRQPPLPQLVPITAQRPWLSELVRQKGNPITPHSSPKWAAGWRQPSRPASLEGGAPGKRSLDAAHSFSRNYVASPSQGLAPGPLGFGWGPEWGLAAACLPTQQGDEALMDSGGGHQPVPLKAT